MATSVIIQQMCIIFILLISGYVLAKRNLVSGSISKEVSTLVINLCGPALMIDSALNANRDIDQELLLFTGALAVIFYLFLILTAEIVVKLLRTQKTETNPYRLMHIFSNTGFIGLPVINAVIGPEGVLFAVIINIGYNVFFYTYGYYRTKKQSAPGEKVSLPLHELINVGMISSILSILIYVANIRLPYIIAESCRYIGSATTFLSLFVIGVNLSKSPLKKIFGDKKMYVFVLLKQVITPILMGLLLRPFIPNETLFYVTVIMAALPVGSLPLMLAEKEGMDSTLFSNGVIVSTVFSVLTIPLVLIIL